MHNLWDYSVNWFIKFSWNWRPIWDCWYILPSTIKNIRYHDLDASQGRKDKKTPRQRFANEITTAGSASFEWMDAKEKAMIRSICDALFGAFFSFEEKIEGGWGRDKRIFERWGNSRLTAFISSLRFSALFPSLFFQRTGK